MSYSSCIRQPEKDRFLQVHEWQVVFCRHNHCAALLLAFFITWHDWKLRHDHYYRRANDIAEVHGDGRPHNESAYLFFSMEELIKGCMGFYGKKTIHEALELLVSLQVITVHQNPNSRYRFDKTKYFKLYPQICNQWLDKNDAVESRKATIAAQVIDYSDQAKVANRLSKNGQPPGESDPSLGESGQAITNNTNNTTSKNQLINARADLWKYNYEESEAIKLREGEIINQKESEAIKPKESEAINLKESKSITPKASAAIKPIVDALVQKGFPARRFNYPDAIAAIQRLQRSGATPEDFMQAYDKALRATQAANPRGNGFGVNYLVKIVEDCLHGKAVLAHVPAPLVDKPNYRQAIDWMGDLLS